MSFSSLLLWSLLVAVVPTTPPAPPVTDLVTEALAKSPALAALRSGVDASRTMERPAGALPDPMVEAMIQDADFPRFTIGKEEMSMAGVEVRQELPYPGKRRARTAVAQAETVRKAAAVEALTRRITAEVRRLYARLYALDRERQTLTAAHDLAEMLAATASTRYASGEAEQESLLKAQLQETRVDEQIDDLAAERSVMVAELNRWLDRPGAAPLGEVRELPAVTAFAGSAEEEAVAASANVQVAQAAVAAAEKKVEAARLDLKPDFSPAAGIGAAARSGRCLPCVSASSSRCGRRTSRSR